MNAKRHSQTSGHAVAQGQTHAFALDLVLTLVLVLFCSVMSARAQISSTGGVVVPVTRADVIAVGSLVEGAYASDTEVRIFMEREGQRLATGMNLDVTADGTYNYPLTPGTLPAGEWVSSVMIHADRASAGGTSHLVGTIVFSVEILGIVIESGTLDAWDPVVGLTALTYPTGAGQRGLEVNDAVWPDPDEIMLNGNTLDLNFLTSIGTDQMRVILAGNARGVTFSIDYQGVTLGTPATWGPGVIDEGDILTVAQPGPSGPNPPVVGPTNPPAVVLEPADLGITSSGAMGLREVDALSFGKDRGGRLFFSVDEFAVGLPYSPPPNVRSEGALPGRHEQAAADAYLFRGPIAPTDTSFTPGNRASIDGDGVAPSGRPGLGLIEPCPPTLYCLPDSGDNLDALALSTRPEDLQGYIYFSLDAAYVDWAEAFSAPPNTGTAVANGVSAADILVRTPGSSSFTVYTTAADLGLQSLLEEDDVDAISVWDRGVRGEYEPGIDRILFSLRRGSASLGTPDCRLGWLITEADVLTPGPCILIPGESLGLDTSRWGIITPYQVPDDLDGMSRTFPHSAPIGNGDEVEVGVGQAAPIPVVENDFPLDGDLVPASLTIVTRPQHGVIEHIDPETGVVTYRHDGSSFLEDLFTYIVFDDRGEFSEETTVFIRVGSMAAEGEPAAAPASTLSCTSPNPFLGRIAFRIQPMQTGHTRVTVFDPAGRQVRILLDEVVAAGTTREFAWDGQDEIGQITAAGIYMVQMKSPAGEEQVRVVKMK